MKQACAIMEVTSDRDHATTSAAPCYGLIGAYRKSGTHDPKGVNQRRTWSRPERSDRSTYQDETGIDDVNRGHAHHMSKVRDAASPQLSARGNYGGTVRCRAVTSGSQAFVQRKGKLQTGVRLLAAFSTGLRMSTCPYNTRSPIIIEISERSAKYRQHPIPFALVEFRNFDQSDHVLTYPLMLGSYVLVPAAFRPSFYGSATDSLTSHRPCPGFLRAGKLSHAYTEPLWRRVKNTKGAMAAPTHLILTDNLHKAHRPIGR